MVIIVSGGEEDFEVSLDSELFLHGDIKDKKRKKQMARFRPLGPEVPPECRIMGLTSFPLSDVFQGDSFLSLHYVAGGCSDAVIR